MDLLTWSDIIIQIVLRLGPVWVALVILFLVSFSLNVHLASMENYLTQQSA